MQELKLILAESDTASLVLREVESGAEFFLPVTEELCSLLSDANPVPSASEYTDAGSDQLGRGISHLSSVPSAGDSSSALASSVSSPSALSTDNFATDDEPSEQPDVAQPDAGIAGVCSDAGTNSVDATSTEPFSTGSSSTGTTSTDTGSSSAGTTSTDATVASAAHTDATTAEKPSSIHSGRAARDESEKKRRHRIRINMTPRTIQDRIRHGASIEELAAEADTDESRIEPYAWPILQERARIAELAHSAHPVTGEGPSKQTLWEVLAAALAARGSTVSDTEWVAFQDSARRWVISVRWEKESAGQSSLHEADFHFEQAVSGPSLAHPLNSVASDLVDPRYRQPVRRISAVTPLLDANPTEDDFSEYDNYDDQGNELREDSPADPHEDFLLHPNDESDAPRNKRKRKSVTPHWEDVLLGVRTNPRKKK